MSEDKRFGFSDQKFLQSWTAYLKERKLVGPYIISGFQIVCKGSRSPAISWNYLDHPNLVCSCYFRTVLNQILLGDLPQSFLDIEILDYSLSVSLIGKQALQNSSGVRCFNSQHLKSERVLKQAKDPPVIAINRVIQKFLPKVSAAVKYVLNDYIWTPRPLIEIFSPEIYVAHYLNYLTIGDIRISGRTLVVISEVDLPLTVMLDAALVSFGSILPIVVVAAWWPLYWSIPETILPYLARVPPDKRQKAQLTLAYEPGVCSLSILDPQSLVDVSLQPCGAPLAGLHTLPWSPPPCQQQRQRPYSTSSPMAAIPQEPSVAPNTRSDAPVWRGLLHLTQSSILRISRKIRCRGGVSSGRPGEAPLFHAHPTR